MPLSSRIVQDERDAYRMLFRLQILLASSCLFILLYALQASTFRTFLQIFGSGLLAACAFLLLGFVAGFIFCIPRTSKPTAVPVGAGTAPASSNATEADAASPIEPNSNLVDISDWLTKIIVGVGLVELKKIPSALHNLCVVIAPALRAPCATSDVPSQSLCLFIILLFTVAGFLIGYLWTRLYYQKALSDLANKATLVDSFWKAVDSASNRLLENKPSEALLEINHALSIDPQSSRALFEKARILKTLAQVSGKPGDQSLLMQALDNVSRAAQLRPNTSSFLYNMACYQALLAHPSKEVLENLAQSIKLAPEYRQYAKGDPDFVSLNSDPDFQSLVNQ